VAGSLPASSPSVWYQISSDGEISYETVNCMGACALGPLVTVDDDGPGIPAAEVFARLEAKYQATLERRA